MTFPSRGPTSPVRQTRRPSRPVFFGKFSLTLETNPLLARSCRPTGKKRMANETSENDARLFEDLQELIALELKDILATADSEGYERKDVVTALELALAAEIQALKEGEAAVAEEEGPATQLAEP